MNRVATEGSSILSFVEQDVLLDQAYKVVVTLNCGFFKNKLGSLEVTQVGHVIGKKDCLVPGENSIIIYPRCKGELQVSIKPDNYVQELHIVEKSIVKCGRALSEPQSLRGLNIVAAVASIPQRVDALMDTVDSVYDQVERLFVYLNGYTSVPEFLKKDKIEYILDPIGRNAAAAKFYWLHLVDAYYFSLDDDIIYPANYCRETIREYESKHKGSVVAYHGKSFKTFAMHPRLDRKKIHLFQNEQLKSKNAHVLGTGVMMIDTREVKQDIFTTVCNDPRSIDLSISILLRKKRIKRIVLKRSQYWLRQNDKVSHGLNEYKQLNKFSSLSTRKQMVQGIPWVEIRYFTPFFKCFSFFVLPVLIYIDEHRKLKKLFREPKQFFKDSNSPILIKLFKLLGE